MAVGIEADLLALYIAAFIGIANVCLLSVLCYIYWQNYREIKSKFTIGLLFFVSFLLVQSLFLTGSIFLHGGFRHGAGLLLVVNNLILLIALSILLKITW